MEFNINHIKQICNASESSGAKAVYSTDSSCIGGDLLAVAWPENLEQLQKLVRMASRDNISLVPRGGGTSLVGGAVPKNEIVIDMSRMNRIRKLVISEKTVTAEAGVYLDSLNSAIAKYGLEFPIKPGSHAACTLGGMISTNAAGLLSKKYKKIEDWVDEITLIDGTGKIFTFSGDEAKRFAGTEGCCGIIVEAKLRLSEIKENTTDMFDFETIPEMMQKLDELQSDANVVALEYINPSASRLLGMSEKERLLVKYSDERGKITHEESEKIWKMRENLYSVLMNAGFQNIEDPYFAQGIEKFLDWINKQNVPAYGHIGYGIVHPHFRTEEEVKRMLGVVKELEGQAAGEHGIGLLKKRYAPLAMTMKIKELKSKYDPNNIMNRSKAIL